MKNKYNSKTIYIDWYTFDSKLEAQFYQENKDKIIQVHPKYLLQDKCERYWLKLREIYYESDFLINIWWKRILIDIKWLATETSLLKRKLFMYKYENIELKRLVFVKKRNWRIDYFENKKLIKEDKKALIHK